MCINLSIDDIKEQISNIPPLYRKFVDRALLEDDPARIQDLGYALTGEKPSSGHIIGLGLPIQKNSLWDRVLVEVHEFLCTNSDVYEEERKKGSGSLQSMVAVVSSSLGASINIGVGIISGLVAVSLVLVTKMGKNAWCKMQSERMIAAS